MFDKILGPSTYTANVFQQGPKVSITMKRTHVRITRRRFQPDAEGSNPFADRILMFDALVEASDEINQADQDQAKPEEGPSVAELRQMMNRETTAREDYLEEIRRKLESGHYLTRSAAEESAERMMNDGDFNRPFDK